MKLLEFRRILDYESIDTDVGKADAEMVLLCCCIAGRKSMPPLLSLNMTRLDREMYREVPPGRSWRVEKFHADGLFLAGLLDALLAGVQGTLLALGRLQHVLLRLGVYESNGQQGTNKNQSNNTYQLAASS